MADFNGALKRTSAYEGWYVNDPDDRGGETYQGISRVYHPDWPGWAILDTIPAKRRGQKFDAVSCLVDDFYRKNFWDKIQGDAITSQRVAEFVYDWFVNSGTAGIKAVQRVLNVPADGIIGPRTIAALNDWDEGPLMTRLHTSRTNYVQQIAANHPSQKKFLKGWLNRINSFK